MAVQCMKCGNYGSNVICDKCRLPDKTTACPECGCVEFVDFHLSNTHRICAKCGQEWFTDIEY